MESNDYDPGEWRGRSFASERKAYDAHAGRSYSEAIKQKKHSRDLIEPSLTTNASWPLAIISDVTGSMGKDPGVFFGKIPYMIHETKEYLGKDAEVCMGACGDANGDKFPIQIRKFESTIEAIKKRLKELIVEGEGGDGIMETYELMALYFARLVEMPKAKHRPILILIADEKPYPTVNTEYAKELLGITIKGHLSTKKLFEELQETWSVYLIRRYYDNRVPRQGEPMDSTNQEIHDAWVKLIGEDHIVPLPNADRVTDVIFGILAKETDRIEYFRQELTERQKEDEGGEEKIAMVLDSMVSIHGPVWNCEEAPKEGCSLTKFTTGGAKKGKRLL